MEVEAEIAPARDGRADSVDDAHGGRSPAGDLVESGDGVGGLAGLRDGDDQRFRVEHGISVAELGGVLHAHRHAGQLFQKVGADEGGVPARAAGGQYDAPRAFEDVAVGFDPAQPGVAAAVEQPSPHHVAERSGLFQYLLAHEVGVVALAMGCGVPAHAVDGALHLAAVASEGARTGGGEHGVVAVVQPGHAPGQVGHRRSVGGDQGDPVRRSCHQDGGGETRRDDLARIAG